MNGFDRQEKLLMRLCFGIAFIMLLSAMRYLFH